MLIRARVKSSAFSSEYQNAPMAEDATFTAVQFWVHLDPKPVYFGALDPSLGKNNRARDPSAILVGAFWRDKPRLDVVEASIRRRLPTVIIRDVIAMQRRHNCALWFVESVQFQEFLRTQLMAQAAREGVRLPARAVIPNTDKDLRIESLQPPMDAGLIRLHASQSVLLAQLHAWPQGDHDDGPDCLEMLWSGAVQYAGLAAGHFGSSGSRIAADIALGAGERPTVRQVGGGFHAVPSGYGMEGY
jgi:predicted phage terminase large subunit-like protein